MKRIVSLTVLLVIILLTLTGCVTVNYELTINSDGSGEISYVYGFDQSYIESTEESAEVLVADMKEQAEENGYTIEAYSDKAIEGFKATKKLKDVTKEFSLEEAFGEENVKDSEDNKIRVEKGMFGTTYSQAASIDLASMENMAGFITMKYSVNLPTKAGKNNANTVSEDGKTLTWVLTAGKETKIEFDAKETNVVGTVLWVLAIVIGVSIILFLLFIIIKKVKSVNNEETERMRDIEQESGSLEDSEDSKE